MLNISHNWIMSQEINNDAKQNLAKNIKKLREKLSLKKEELSLQLGFENSYISKVENCRMNITLNRLISIANFFNIKIQDLFK